MVDIYRPLLYYFPMEEIIKFFHPFVSVLVLLWKIISPLWWIWGPLIVLSAIINNWLSYVRRKYWQSINWTILEIRPSSQAMRSPKAIEQILHSLWNIFGSVSRSEERDISIDQLPSLPHKKQGVNSFFNKQLLKWNTIKEKFLHGAIQDYFSLEIISVSGEIHFLIRFPQIYQKIVESQIYSQAPQVELIEVEDYTKLIPPSPIQKGWDVWGTKFILSKDDPYPIRTYPDFIDAVSGSAPEPEGIIDPLTYLIEALGKLQADEHIWLQIIARPVNDGWKENGRKLINKIIGRIEKKELSLIVAEIKGWVEASKNVINVLFRGEAIPAEEIEEDRKVGQSLISHLPPGEKKGVEAIENKISKKGFETKINLIYLSPKKIFNKSTVAPIIVFIKQFSSSNSFVSDNDITTLPANKLLSQSELLRRKEKIIKLCRGRSFWSDEESDEGSILNSEEIASIFHLPFIPIESPAIPQIKYKKVPPPPELPIE